MHDVLVSLADIEGHYVNGGSKEIQVSDMIRMSVCTNDIVYLLGGHAVGQQACNKPKPNETDLGKSTTRMPNAQPTHIQNR